MKNYFLLTLIGVNFMFTSLFSEEQYRRPEKRILDVYNAPSMPYMRVIPFSELILEFTYQDKQTLQDLAEPTIKLAGKEISTRLNGKMDTYPVLSIAVINSKTQKRTVLELPKAVKIRNYRISFDHSKMALSYEAEKGIQLIVVDLYNYSVFTFPDIYLNDAFGDDGYMWMDDHETLLLTTIPENRSEKPEINPLPQAPVIEETKGKFSQVRTYTNLLQNKKDKILFEYYFFSQIELLNTRTQKRKKIGNPGLFSDIQPSPDHQYLLVTKIEKPYSYSVPYYYFPKNFEIWDIKGNIVQIFHQRPLQDEIPIGGTYQGPRYLQWQANYPAKLLWVEAQDEGNPKNSVEFRDFIFRKDVRTSDIEKIYATKNRFSGIEWSQDKDEMIIYEYDRDNLWYQGWLYSIRTKSNDLIIDRSIHDNYNALGSIVKRTTLHGETVFIKKNQNVFFINNQGATPDGNRPFMISYSITDRSKNILYQCQENFHERIYGILDSEHKKILIRSENSILPPNYYMINLDNMNRKKITDYKNPYPDYAQIQKKLVTYTRKDSIPLSGTLYLPQDYQKGNRLPLVLHAYPEEFTDSSTAGQIDANPNQFPRYSGTTIKYFVLNGYAVLANASFPIIGNPETVNETFIEQTLASAQAAITYLDKEEIIDPDKVGIIGHSYGAFMVANVLAHSQLCAAGIAKSGAYNRTLTPFGFQSERRTFWQAKDFYMHVSPFMFADKIKSPILLIHGKDDPNSGTYPIQSERFFQALKGNGATAKLVLLPLEKHGYRAQESQLHVITEMLEWFDKFVK